MSHVKYICMLLLASERTGETETDFLSSCILSRICKRLRSSGIDSKESIPPAYVAWRAGTTTISVFSILHTHQIQNPFCLGLN